MLETERKLHKMYVSYVAEKKNFENLLDTKPNIDKEYIVGQIIKLDEEIEFIKKVANFDE